MADEFGRTPLWLACQDGHVDAARLLLDKGADVNRADKDGTTPLDKAKCRPGCESSMHTLPGFNWWDLYNVTKFFHALGHDVFILSMPLKGINLGPGTTDKYLATDHWWFLQWEEKGDSPLRYFLEPAVLTMNFAKAQGYGDVYMAGLSGGGWSTTFASAIDKRIKGSFPIAGSVPCAMRNPLGTFPAPADQN